VEERLQPINALLGLTVGNGLDRAPFRDAGFRVAGLEIPVTTVRGSTVIDLVLFNAELSLLVACEAKSGRNVEDDQAEKYASLDATAVVQASQVTLTRRVRPRVIACYACKTQHLTTVRYGLNTLGLKFPVVAVGDRKIVFDCPEVQPEPLNEVFATSELPLGGPSPRLIAFDHESSVEVIEPYVKAQLVATLSHSRQQMTVRALAEQAAPHFALYGRKARNQLVKKASQAVRHIADTESTYFEYVAGGGNNDDVVRLLRTPEDNDPRGRTQAYQALARGRQMRKRSPKVDPNQLDLLREVEQVDDGGMDELSVEKEAES
jgi:hypothetical protein